MQTIQLAGDYDFARADELRSLLQAADPADTLTLDCSKVTYFDSAAIAELVRLRRERNARRSRSWPAARLKSFSKSRD